MLKYNVGDKVRVRSDLKVGVRYGSMSFLEGMSHLRGKVATIEDCTPCSYKVEEDYYEFWTDEMFEGLAEEEPIPTPTPVVNVNVTVNLYENACWYCRKGGLVDLYFNGLPGICPKCGRVMNLFAPNNMFNNNKREEAPKKPKENKPLTKEELEALPNGTKVFIVWRWDMDSDSKKEPSWDESGWGVKKEKLCRWSYEGCEETWQGIDTYDRCFDAYLEEPERPS